MKKTQFDYNLKVQKIIIIYRSKKKIIVMVYKQIQTSIHFYNQLNVSKLFVKAMELNLNITNDKNNKNINKMKKID